MHYTYILYMNIIYIYIYMIYTYIYGVWYTYDIYIYIYIYIYHRCTSQELLSHCAVYTNKIKNTFLFGLFFFLS